jgi:hypothetical protein
LDRVVPTTEESSSKQPERAERVGRKRANQKEKLTRQRSKESKTSCGVAAPFSSAAGALYKARRTQ